MGKKILLGILIFFLGMIFGLVALFGTGYLLIAKTKLGSITGLFMGGDKNEIISEELEDYSILQAIKFLTDGEKTIGEYEDLLPVLSNLLDSTLNNEEISKFVAFDREKIDGLTLSTLGSGISEAISVVATLNSLKETFSFELPNLPLINSKESYVKITDEQFNIINNYYKNSGRKAEIYCLDGETYVTAYDGETLKTEAQGKDLYYHTVGILDLPINDAITTLSKSLDVSTLTIGELEANFGIKLLTDNEGNASVFANLFTAEDKVNDISTLLSDRIDACTLTDFGMTVEEDGILDKILTKKVGEGAGEHLTVGELTDSEILDGQIDGLLISDLGVSLTGLASKVIKPEDTVAVIKTPNTLNERIDALTIEDLGIAMTGVVEKILQPTDSLSVLKAMDENDPTKSVLEVRINNLQLNEVITITAGDNELLDSLSTTKIKDLTSRIDNLTVKDVFGENPSSKAIKDLMYVHDKTTGIATSELTKVDNISDEIPYIMLESVITVDKDTNSIIKALVEKGTNISNLSEKANELSLLDAFPDIQVFGEVTTSTYKTDKRVYVRSGEEGSYVYTQIEHSEMVAGTTYYQIGEVYDEAGKQKNHGIWLIIDFDREYEDPDDKTSPIIYKQKDVKLEEIVEEVEDNEFGSITMTELYEMGYLETKPIRSAYMDLNTVLEEIEGNI